jgi:hypothetical protein
MERTILIGDLDFKSYPVLSLYKEFTHRLTLTDSRNLFKDLNGELKLKYIKYTLTVAFLILLSSGLFTCGYLFYRSIFGLSILFGLLFVLTFILTSKTYEVKLSYMKTFQLYLRLKLNKYRYENEEYEFIETKWKMFLYLNNSLQY